MFTKQAIKSVKALERTLRAIHEYPAEDRKAILDAALASVEYDVGKELVHLKSEAHQS